MIAKDEIRMRFETVAVFRFAGYDVAYGSLYLNDIRVPALRIHMDAHITDLPLKIDGDHLSIVEKAPYYVQIPPYRYITYVAPFNVLYLISTRGAKRVFCNADREKCDRLPPVVCGNVVEDVFNIIKDVWVGGDVL